FPHIGDVRSLAVAREQERTVRALLDLTGLRPQYLATDLHPDMESTRLGQRLASEWEVPVVAVQHHEAHALACMAEHGTDTGLALVFDGMGLGRDGTLWGAELLWLGPDGCRRLGTFQGVPLPGGDAAVRQPARQLAGRLATAGVTIDETLCHRLGLPLREAEFWGQQARRGLNAPISHAAGRLFDAFAALLGIAPATVDYEGRAAVLLEQHASRWRGPLPRLPFRLVPGTPFVILWDDAFLWGLDALRDGQPVEALALAFHHAVAEAAATMARLGADLSGEKQVFLSGGVFQNRLLCATLSPALQAQGLTPRMHGAIPPNDNGISCGQVIAAERALQYR
ncbi:MAG: carbamoyltransferase HypF, partial [Alphaproteobacteria bacterium]